ncbi:MAG TPA: hypothetical protein PKA13_11110 [Geminicoccaceae bacterium]|nr:hypothetical protein [Geminicoccus sp.]HMU50314.1 hypothetical protein [Geminicoccaceae bacterium]
MAKLSKLRLWARDVGVSDRGAARLLGVSRWTVVSWRRDDVEAREPADWREKLIEGLQREIDRLRRHAGPDKQSC